MRLWKVTCTTTVVVVSAKKPSKQDCIDCAVAEVQEQSVAIRPTECTEITSLADVPKGWKDCIPWPAPNPHQHFWDTQRTVAQLLKKKEA